MEQMYGRLASCGKRWTTVNFFSQTRDINTLQFTHVKPVQFTQCTYVQGKKNHFFFGSTDLRSRIGVSYLGTLRAYSWGNVNPCFVLLRSWLQMFYGFRLIDRIFLWFGKGTISCAQQARAYSWVMYQKQRSKEGGISTWNARFKAFRVLVYL